MKLVNIEDPRENSTEKSNIDNIYYAVGIDLGTTNSVMASINDNNQVHFYKDSKDRALLPSCVHYLENGKHIVGYDAVAKLTSDPENTFMSSKRALGRSIDELSKLNYQLTDKDVSIPHYTSSRIKVSPMQVLANILSELVSRASALKENQNKKFKGAVITVPAYFDESKRQAIKDAAALAGINVLRLINEPTAAAYAYGLDSNKEGVYLFYDLGGGTFDISILSLQKGVFKVISTGGDNTLGGDDIDECILKHLCSIVNVKYNEVSKQQKIQLLKTAAQIKHQLNENVSVNVEFKLNNTQYNCSINIETFNQIVTPIFDKTYKLIKKTLLDASLNENDIDGMVLVGGSTKSKALQQYLRNKLDIKQIDGVDPDLVVAQGAASVAYNLSGNKNSKNKQVLLLDIVPLTLCLETYGGVCEKIIARGSHIPITVSQQFTTFKDNQTGFLLHILQGERELVKDNRSLAKVSLKGIPPMPAASAKLKVTFTVDVDGMLSISAIEETSNISTAIEIKPSYGLSEEELNKMLSESVKNADDDLKLRRVLEKKVEAEQIIAILEQAFSKSSELLEDKQKENIKTTIEILKNSLASNDLKEITENLKNLEKVSTSFISKHIDKELKQTLDGML